MLTIFTASSLPVARGFSHAAIKKGGTGITYSLATASHSPSFEMAISRTGKAHLTRILSIFPDSISYCHTVPSSAPIINESFYPQASKSAYPAAILLEILVVARTVAAIAK